MIMAANLVYVSGTHQRVTPAGATWIQQQIDTFRLAHHRDPVHRELIDLVQRWHLLETTFSARVVTRKIHKKICATVDYSWRAPRPLRGN